MNNEDHNFFDTEDLITTKEFVILLMEGCKISMEPGHEEAAAMDYALKKGIIEDYDITNWDNPIKRSCAARIVHDAMLTLLSEKDEKDWSAAEHLLDLYSCRSCVKHIAQVYVKGIMSEHKEKLFEPEGKMAKAQARSVIARMLDKDKRIPVRKGGKTAYKILGPDEAWRLLAAEKAILVDVRSHEEYRQGHIAGSRSVPFEEISINPYVVCARKDTPIILYCHMGYKSSLAAGVLIEAGYTSIYTIPGVGQYDYDLVN